MGDNTTFDAAFLDGIDPRIVERICATLQCDRRDIVDVAPVSAGLTNKSFRFSCAGEAYIYRHPGVGSDALINRTSEAYALGIARKLGLDSTFVHEDPIEGWKISRFIPGCVEFDYGDEAQVDAAMELIRRLHRSGETSPWSLDFHEEALRILDMLEQASYPIPDGFSELRATIDEAAAFLARERGEKVFCHNDFYGPNILVKDGRLQLIDWEYAAMGDYGCDLGNFIAQTPEYSLDDCTRLFDSYFQRPATPAEARHCLACAAVVGFYWYVWSMFQEMQGNPMGEWQDIWRRAAQRFGAQVLPSYRCDPALRARRMSRKEFDRLVARAEAGKASEDELQALEPYRAKRAVLLAAGFGSRLLPITATTPKPLVRVHGVRIIDRLIDALRAVGIEEIYVVRGYLKDEFDQLLPAYPMLRFIDNPLYDSTNNISSAAAAAGCFENAYVFESDLLLANPGLVTKYQFESNYLAIPVPATEDWCFDADEKGSITRIAKGSDKPCWQMVGLSFWTKEDGARLAADIPAVFAQGGDCAQIFWDDVALVHRADAYDVHVRECSFDDVVEIDTFAELQVIDSAYAAEGD